MYSKIFKKLIGHFGYKLVNKDLIKNNRILNNKNLISLSDFLSYLFENNQISNLIQVGANDGLRFDEINKYIKKYKPKTVLVEPISEHFEQLKNNYKDIKNIFFENVAIDVNNEINFLYKVDKSKINLYDDHIQGISSFNLNHLKKHGVRSHHIKKEKVKSISIIKLINKYFTSLDLLLIDAEGYDGFIIIEFLKKSNFRPIIIFEYIHIKHDSFKNLINLLKEKDYYYYDIRENIICFPKEKKPLIKLT